MPTKKSTPPPPPRERKPLTSVQLDMTTDAVLAAVAQSHRISKVSAAKQLIWKEYYSLVNSKIIEPVTVEGEG